MSEWHLSGVDHFLIGLIVGIVVTDALWSLVNHFATRRLIRTQREYIDELLALLDLKSAEEQVTMKPTYQPPPPRALTDDERVMLRCSAAGGAHPVRATGSSQHALCRRLAKMGLGTFEDGAFTVNARGEAAVAAGQ